ncbi:MAG TPA: Re/Si-specific NAD(P)(+) transhydrogenase subunit alpha [Trueperaceae bacterium]
MILFAGKEPPPESRVALMPNSVARLVELGFEVRVARGIGDSLHLNDESYEEAGARIVADDEPGFAEADLVVRLNAPTAAEVEAMKRGSILVSFLDPFRNPELISRLVGRGISTLCMELIPRSTYAQKMDALSSQASLAGYAAVIVAAERIDKALPMMSTPAGTIAPARVFVVGVGVAGLQAIATAKRLGARVEAYDTRPVVEEQVQSLGARFVKIDVGETGQTEQGYAKALTEEQLEMQRKQMARYCANSDILITTAQVFGRPAPRIITAEMVAGMRPGSVVVDLAASTGGNVEGTVAGQEVDVGGVRIVGLANMPGQVARDASQMYSSNVYNLIEHAFDKELGRLELDTSDAVVDSCLLTSGGEVRHEQIRALVEATA